MEIIHDGMHVLHHNIVETLPSKQCVFVRAINLICVALAKNLGGPR